MMGEVKDVEYMISFEREPSVYCAAVSTLEAYK